jgi:20S proteasome subunit beta 2
LLRFVFLAFASKITYCLSFNNILQLASIIKLILHKDAVVLGADTRATEGPIVCDKNCEKIHYIAPNIYCCGAGTSADTENSTGTIINCLHLLIEQH